MTPARGLKIAQVATSDISIRFLLLDHIAALQRQGHEVTAVCAPGEWLEDIRRAGVPVATVPMARQPRPFADLHSLSALTRCFQERRFDVVHTHTPKAGLLGPLAARSAGVPRIVHTIHGLLFHDAMPSGRQLFYWLPEKLTAICAHHLLSQSREDIDVAVQRKLCRPEKIRYIGNGIDVEQFSPPTPAGRAAARAAHAIASDEFVVGSIGRLVAEKGFNELFAASEHLKYRNQKVRIIVIGPEEPGRSDAIPVHRKRDLSDRGIIQFAGHQTALQPWLACFDAFALASHREGIPRVCLEAAASGLPVVACDIRGCREVVLHEKTGLLVPVNSPAALAAAIELLLLDREAARRMGQKGVEHVRAGFDQRDVLKRLCDFYDELSRNLPEREAAR